MRAPIFFNPISIHLQTYFQNCTSIIKCLGNEIENNEQKDNDDFGKQCYN